jgi:plasmid rolling circle replication initiator protein Rep
MPHYDKKKFDENYGEIDWRKLIPKKFKTSWGAEYTVWIREERETKKDWKKYNSPTLQSTIKESPKTTE